MEVLVKILSGLLTPTIAIIAVYIAYQQYRINRNKLKLELYEKRYTMYLLIKDHVYKWCLWENVEIEDIREFNVRSNECKFLFDSDINDLISKIQQNSSELTALKSMLSKGIMIPKSEKREDVEKQQNSLFIWFNELYFNIEEHFVKYLDFKKF